MGEGEEKKGLQLPLEFVDAHHHFLDTGRNEFQSWLGSLLPNTSYLPKEYETDVVQPLEAKGIKFVGSIHVECMPDDAVKEVEWVDSLSREGSTVQAIVASVDLTSDTVESELDALQKSSSLLRGVRWILDYVGPFDGGKTATHVATTRHGVGDYLRGHDNGKVLPAFERGYSVLEKHSARLTFDLQCAPVQLPQAAELVARHPGVNVCVDHLGKPRTILKDDGSIDDEELRVWRDGMRAMAAIPHVYCKISMLGYVIPGWIQLEHGRSQIEKLVSETIQMFGPKRCMVGLNWWKNGAMSDADGLSDVGPDPVQFIELCASFFSGYSKPDQERLFCGTAREFYRF